MKSNIYKIVLSAIALVGAVTLAKAVSEHVESPSIGNALLMQENLNFPNATSPGRNNIQLYEKKDVILGRNIHTEEDLANSYNRNFVK